MMDRDMRPTRFDLMLQYAREFVTEWFDQNPLGQIGVVGMRGGLGERVGEMSGMSRSHRVSCIRLCTRISVGNPQDVLKAISERHKLEPNGEPSLQNAIEMARSSMSHLPTHSSREILVIFGSLTTCDPGNIHDTLDECVKDRIRISVVALAAEMKICRDLCEKTGGERSILYHPEPAYYLLDSDRRPVWRRHERRSLQRPSLRTHPPTSAACSDARRRDGGEPCSRPNDHGLPDASPRHVSTLVVCVPLANEERGLSMPTLPRQGVRRPDRLRHLRANDRELAPPRAELPPPLPCQAVRCCVSGLNRAEI